MSVSGAGNGGSNWTGLPMFAASHANVSDYMSPAAGDYNLGRINVQLNPQMQALHSVYGTHLFGSVSQTTTLPGFVASAATLNAPGDALLGSAVRYPQMSIPMPYSQVQVQSTAQLIEPALERVKQAQQGLLYMPVSQRPRRALPAANPALYAAAIEGGYKPNAYLTDYHDPYGGAVDNVPQLSTAAMGVWGHRDHNTQHSMHPHIQLMAAMDHPNSNVFTQCGVPLG